MFESTAVHKYTPVCVIDINHSTNDRVTDSIPYIFSKNHFTLFKVVTVCWSVSWSSYQNQYVHNAWKTLGSKDVYCVLRVFIITYIRSIKKLPWIILKSFGLLRIIDSIYILRQKILRTHPRTCSREFIE